MNQQKVMRFCLEELDRLCGKKDTALLVDDALGEEEFLLKPGEIRSGSARGLLYGVYACAERKGYRFLDFEEHQTAPSQGIPDGWKEAPVFKRRGNVIETIDDRSFLHSMIDWGAKNRLNEFFFTFFLWDEVKEDILPALEKRGFSVTLGGHSLKFLMEKAGMDPEAAMDFFRKTEEEWDPVVDVIRGYCADIPVVTRISLWPEDAPAQKGDFLSAYLQFTEYLKRKLPDIEVEHIAYNAGLAWHMLERESETKQPESIDTLFAFWGRDYSRNFQEEKRAWKSFKDWRGVANKLTVFEYYSDHFLLSELFPPLPRRIHKDFKAYRRLGADGVLNLVVPRHHPKMGDVPVESYDWKWVQLLNNYVAASEMWGKAVDMEECFAGDTSGVWHMLEKAISPLSGWNIPLFPERAVDSGDAKVLPSLEEAQAKVGEVAFTTEGKRDEKLAAYVDDLQALLSFHENRVQKERL
ncbi:hypothetical protein [Salimicrobium halophilum]|uniref:Uncharacterized protein n=1 Tax=Salimicrobium halophilum TaxID=86666 RepID=A0A1G8S9G9_9BACI|nr:hypothetical protein [Salimicrobium halophilum]SDJ25886.1 hypothetical protein SAMN04490247_1330 [Salimicrobium halophilum]